MKIHLNTQNRIVQKKTSLNQRRIGRQPIERVQQPFVGLPNQKESELPPSLQTKQGTFQVFLVLSISFMKSHVMW